MANGLAGRPIVELASTTGAHNRGEIFAGGMHLATYSSSNTYFAYTDWMGSERVRTTSAGVVAQTCAWSDFGESSTCTTNTDPDGISPHGYAAYEYDPDTQLHHMWFRDYNPRLGRFLTTDPLAGDIGDPQSLNRYAYVTNNPANFVDPLGLNPFAPATSNPGWCSPQWMSCDGGYWWSFGWSWGWGDWDGGGGWGSAGGGGRGSSAPPKPGGYEDFPGGESLGFPTSMPLRMPTLADLLIPGSAQCHYGPCTTNALPAVLLAGAACARIHPCREAFRQIVTAVGGAVIIAYSYYAKKADIKQFDDAVKAIERRCGRVLTPAERRTLHDDISGEIGGNSYQDIVERGVQMVCPGK